MSWVIIFILMFAFPPIGLILLILKMRSYAKPSTNSSQKNSTTAGQTRSTTKQAKDTTEHVVSQASKTAHQAINQASTTAQNAITQASVAAQELLSQVAGSLDQSEYKTYSEKKTTEQAAKSKNVTKQTVKPKKTKESNQLSNKSGKVISIVLLLIAIALFIIGANTMVSAATDIWGGGILTRWPEFWLGVFYFAGGFISLFSRNIVTKRLGRYKNYYAFIHGRDVIPMSDIAQTSGVSIRKVRRDIQTMVNEGYFDADAYIDNELDSLVLCNDTANNMRKSVSPFDDISQTEEVPENQYMSTISELHELNLSVADITISRKINKIEELTAKIFRIVEEHPEKKKQIRRFESYYLPTTMKLIRSYSILEKQGVKGENIMTAKENIGRILDTLATGYEQQLDQLFTADAMDIEADINVLESLMQQDGLARDKAEFKTMTG